MSYYKLEDNKNEIYYKIDNAKNAKANLIINHGFAEHLHRYDYVASRLVDAGYNVLRYDLRGHGQSTFDKGHIESYEEFIDDAYQMLILMKRKNPNLENYMLGHSMGGLVSTIFGLRYPHLLKGQILSGAANGKLSDTKNFKDVILKFASKIIPKGQMKNPVSSDICSVEEVVKDYLADPLVLKSASFNFYNEFLNKATDDVLLNMSNYKLPVLILHGEHDKIVPAKISSYLYDSISSSSKELIIYPDLYHEILNENNKDDILKDIINWLEKQSI